MPKRTPAYRESRRDQLLAGARRAFAEHGFEGTTVAVLERELGVSRGAIFNYWPNKLAIFMELAERDAVDISRQSELLARGPAAMVEDLIERARADREWFGVYLEATRVIRRDPELWARWEKRSADAAERMGEAGQGWRARGLVRDDLSDDDVFALIFTLLDGIVLQVATTPQPSMDSYAVLPGLVADALAPRSPA
jgi:TetR/AcrR family transcriptional regulator, transcriptional repressor of aconitase